MSVCMNCGRELRGYVMGAETWLSLFCSPMCRDTAKPPAPKREYITARACDVPGCFVCSGAMRERKGDANG